MKFSYETERLLLKVLDENDYERVLDYIIRNKEFLKEFELKREEKILYYRISNKAIEK